MRLASMVLPEPGGPSISRLWPPAAAIGDRPLGHLLAADVGEIDVVGARARGTARRAARACGSISISPVRKATAWARLATGMTSMPSTTAASAALALGTSRPRRLLPARPAAMAIDSAPLVGRVLPSRASSPTTAYWSNRSDGDLPAAGQDAQRDRQIERRGLFGQIGRGQVDDDAVLRPLRSPS